MLRSQAATLLACVGLVVLALAPATGAGVATGESSQTLQQSQFDRTSYTIEVFENGSARWTVSYRRPLANDSEVQEFQTYADRFNSEETELYSSFRTRADDLTAEAGSRLDREMTATGFTKEARVRDQGFNRIGVVEMSFVWTGFAVEDGGALTVGDVFEGGFFIGPNERLIVRPGPNLAITSASPEPDRETERSVAWDGGDDGQQFLSARPRVVFGERGAAAGTDGGPGGGGVAGLPLWLLGTAVIVVAFGGAVVYRSGVLTTGDDDPGGAAATEGGPDPESDPDSGSGSADETGVEDGEPAAVADEELLSDEDRVMSMLRENGGRMKQVNIVEETGWSKSKVSMLLSDMEEEDRISKLRVGRENIISIRGEEPEGVSSPFDED
jgi:hypothetical protein